MAAKLTIHPDHAHVPNALPVFMLRPSKPLRYPLWTRLSDRWAGRRDRADAPRTAGDEAPVADTPWLNRITGECDHRIAVERVRTEALVAIIEREEADLTARIQRAETIITAGQVELERISEVPISDDVVGSGEHYSPAEERLQRRRLELASARAATQDRITSAADELLEINARLEVLAQERRSHQAVLKERVRNLTKYYQRRAATYVRAMERRRDGITWQVPELRCPDWAVTALGTGNLSS